MSNDENSVKSLQDIAFTRPFSYNIKVILHIKDVMALTTDQQTPVKIHLVTTVRQDGDEEVYEMVVFGRLFHKGQAVYLEYDEVQEDGTVHSIVKIGDNEATILRSGIVNMRLKFKINERMSGSHVSEVGSLLLTTNAQKIFHEENKDTREGQIQLHYDLSMQGTAVGHYQMVINYKEDTARNEYS